MKDRIAYWRRIFKVYFAKDDVSYLTFWHETPAVSDSITLHDLGCYYMTFREKTDYKGPRDKNGVILFDYFFDIGRQYNPLAIAQYGLGYYNLYLKNGETKHFEEAKKHTDWLIDHLEKNKEGFFVWKHHFRWHYKQYLEPGWYSAHSQGTGISLLARMYRETGDKKYLEASQKAFKSLDAEVEKGGVKYTDREGNVWLEEYMVNPPTHILNGFLWALWGVWDYWLLTRDERAKNLFWACIATLKKNLPKYDFGFWSLYDLSEQTLKMIASHFYHKLHIVQLKATFLISGDTMFDEYSKKWKRYEQSALYRGGAFVYKAIFKLLYF